MIHIANVLGSDSGQVRDICKDEYATKGLRQLWMHPDLNPRPKQRYQWPHKMGFGPTKLSL